MSRFSLTRMSRTRHGSLAVAFVVPVALFAGPSVGAEPQTVADFALIDSNSTSSTYNQPVSPRDYMQQVSAWYFGHAT